MKFVDFNYKEKIEKYIFVRNWIEPRLTLYNKNVLEFYLSAKPETQSAILIKNLLDDVFFKESKMFVAFYARIDKELPKNALSWRSGKKYFKWLSLKKLLQKKFISRDEDNEDENYIVVCETKRKNFKIDKFLADYFEDNLAGQLIFISLKNGTAIHLYGSSGFDVFAADAEFHMCLENRYKCDL